MAGGGSVTARSRKRGQPSSNSDPAQVPAQKKSASAEATNAASQPALGNASQPPVPPPADPIDLAAQPPAPLSLAYFTQEANRTTPSTASTQSGGGSRRNAAAPQASTVKSNVAIQLLKFGAKIVGAIVSGAGAWTFRRLLWQTQQDVVPQVVHNAGRDEAAPVFVCGSDVSMVKLTPYSFNFSESGHNLRRLYPADSSDSIARLGLMASNGWVIVFVPTTDEIDMVRHKRRKDVMRMRQKRHCSISITCTSLRLSALYLRGLALRPAPLRHSPSTHLPRRPRAILFPPLHAHRRLLRVVRIGPPAHGFRVPPLLPR